MSLLVEPITYSTLKSSPPKCPTSNLQLHQLNLKIGNIFLTTGKLGHTRTVKEIRFSQLRETSLVPTEADWLQATASFTHPSSHLHPTQDAHHHPQSPTACSTATTCGQRLRLRLRFRRRSRHPRRRYPHSRKCNHLKPTMDAVRLTHQPLLPSLILTILPADMARTSPQTPQTSHPP